MVAHEADTTSELAGEAGARQPADGGFLRCSGVAILLHADGNSQVAVLLAGEFAPERIAVSLARWRGGYTRMRKGALAYGFPEPYVEDRSAINDTGALRVDSYLRGAFPGGTPLFGAVDAVVLIPPLHDHSPEYISVPIASIGNPMSVVFHRASRFETGRSYAVKRVERLDGWHLCKTCGKLCPTNEAHTSAHGVPGHFMAAAEPGDWLDEPRGSTHRLDDPSEGRTHL